MEVRQPWDIQETEDGRFLLKNGPEDDNPEVFKSYELALQAYIEISLKEKAIELIDSFFNHYFSYPIVLKIANNEEFRFEECIEYGYDFNYFLAHSYREWLKRECRLLYAQLTDLRSKNKKYQFEIDEMREMLLKLFDLTCEFQRAEKEWHKLYDKKEGGSNEE